MSLADTNIGKHDCEALDNLGESIASHSKLSELNLMRNIISKPGALTLSTHLAQNKNITTIRVDPCLCDEAYNALCRISNEKAGKKKSKKKK